jgi:hypothetical protein
MSHIFVSYSRKDSDFVKTLVQRLERTHRVWFDRHDIHGGEEWEKAITQGVQNSVTMIVVISPDSVESDYVRFEYSTAIKEEIPIIPLVHRDCDLPVKLGKYHAIWATDDDWFDQVLAGLDGKADFARTHDTTYLTEHERIGDSEVTFDVLAQTVQGSFRMDRHETNLVALPLLVTQHAMTYLVGRATDTLARKDPIQLALQCSQPYNSDNFPVSVAQYTLAQSQPLHMILVRGPMMLTQHSHRGIQMQHGLDNDNPDEWRGVISAAYDSLDAYDTGTNRRKMVQVFSLAPAALMAGFGLRAERGRGLTIYNFAGGGQYAPVYVLPSY